MLIHSACLADVLRHNISFVFLLNVPHKPEKKVALVGLRLCTVVSWSCWINGHWSVESALFFLVGPFATNISCEILAKTGQLGPAVDSLKENIFWLKEKTTSFCYRTLTTASHARSLSCLGFSLMQLRLPLQSGNEKLNNYRISNYII